MADAKNSNGGRPGGPSQSGETPADSGMDAGAGRGGGGNRGGGGLSDLAIRRPVFTSMVMIGLIVLGFFGYRRLAIDQFPEIEFPVVAVQVVYPGASAETIEREVTRPLEEAFNPIQGVESITSTTLEGVSSVIIQFELERDPDLAAQDVRAKIATVRRELPEDVDAPVVRTFDPGAIPIISLALSSETMPAVRLTSLAEERVQNMLQAVAGVGQVQISGGLAREIRVNLHPAEMQALDVSVTEVMAALRQQNLEVPAGRLERGARQQLVRVTGRITDPAQFGRIIVANRGGRAIRLSEVATVLDATEEQQSLARVNDERAIALDIIKVSGANTVEVAEGVKEAVAELGNVLPPAVELSVIRDNSVTIEHSVSDLIFELILGALLTVLVVMLFLNDPKATAITSLALPVSIISSFILMNALGFTLNLISLMALALSIGILVDDAIVVIENIVRHREMGRDHFSAASEGTREIFLAVMATTFSIVAVFIPVAFMDGIIGRFFYQFGVTVAWAVLVSLFVSFTLTPMLSAWWGVEPHGGGEAGPVRRVIGRFNRWFDRVADRYRGLIRWALGHRKTTLGVAAASFIAAIMLFPMIGGSFMPSSDDSQFMVNFQTPEGSTLAYTERRARQIGGRLRDLEGVEYTYTTIGAGQTGSVTDGSVFVKLVAPDEREPSQAMMMVAARDVLAPLYGVETSVLLAGGFGGARAPLAVEIRGPDMEELRSIANVATERIGAIPGIVGAQSSLGEPQPEYRIQVKREIANELDLTVAGIAAAVRPVIAGVDVTRWEDPSGEERDVVVQIAPQHRRSFEDLASLPIPVPGDDGTSVALGQVARIVDGTAPAEITRDALRRIVTVGASTTPGYSIAEASGAIRAELSTLDLPPGYTVTLGGNTEQLEETFGYAMEALLLAVILIFLILASQFESFTQPFAIMLSLPLSLVGVLVVLLLTGDTLNMMSMIGIILLMGLVTKNAILLVDNANERRQAGSDRRTALIEAGRVRLRPIIMTTLAMIFGMLPIALALGSGSGFRSPMARAVIGGLITSTLLTLIVVPVAYTYVDDIGAWFKHLLQSEKGEQASDAEPDSATPVPESRPGAIPAGAAMD